MKNNIKFNETGSEIFLPKPQKKKGIKPAPAKHNKIIISIIIIILLIIIISIITITYFLLRNKKNKAEEIKEKAEDLLISGKEKAEELLQDVGVIKEEKFWKKPSFVISGVIGTVIIITLSLYFYFNNQEK